MKFKIGDKVRVKEDLLVGKLYKHEDSSVNDIFSLSMRDNMGKEAKIIGIERGKYMLDIDILHCYVDDMLECASEKDNKLTREPYVGNLDVEKLVKHMLKLAPQQLINDSLDKGDKERFHELTNKYLLTKD